MPPKKSSVVLLYGYYIYYDDYNRAKLMFLDDYDSDDISDKQKFTKLFITRKSKSRGYAPISDDQKHFYIKCKKDSVGLNGLNDSPKLVPIKELIQHKVECIAKVNEYKLPERPERPTIRHAPISSFLNLLILRKFHC